MYFNAYLNSSSQFIYKTTGAASAYSLATGAHRWYTAPSGTAGNVITLTQAMTLDNSGRLLIGTTSSIGVDKVRINNDGTTSYSTVNITNANSTANMYVGVGGNNVANVNLRDNAYVWNAAASALAFGTSDTERMRITSGGNVGIGTTSPLSKLHVDGTMRTVLTSGVGGDTLIAAINGVSNGYVINVDTSNNITHTWHTGGNVISMRINSAGNVLINSTSTIASKLVVASSTSTSASYSAIFASSSGSDILDIRGDGLITMPFLVSVFTTGNAANVWTNPSNGDLYRSTSSIKYKKNVENYTKGLTELMQLRPVSYEGKNEVDAGKTFAGLIAEEVHELGLTEYVQYDVDGSPNALSYQNMVTILIKSVQELKIENEKLKVILERNNIK